MKGPLEVIFGRVLVAILIVIVFSYNLSLIPEYLPKNVIKNVEGYESFGRHNSAFFGIVMENLVAENRNTSFVLAKRNTILNKSWLPDNEYYRDWILKRFTKLRIRYETETPYGKSGWYIGESQFQKLKQMSVYQGIAKGGRPLKFWVVKDGKNLEDSQNVFRFYAHKDNILLVTESLIENN